MRMDLCFLTLCRCSLDEGQESPRRPRNFILYPRIMPKGKAGYEAGSSKGEAHSNNFGITTFYLHEGVILYLANLLIYF